MILVDTNILIEFYKNNLAIKGELERLGIANLSVSVITVGELYFGARDKRELQTLQKHLALLEQVQIDTAISAHFVQLLADYALSHRLSLPDALIAATALQTQRPLYTLNLKDFQYISGLQIYLP